jgi:hypothetical protein
VTISYFILGDPAKVALRVIALALFFFFFILILYYDIINKAKNYTEDLIEGLGSGIRRDLPHLAADAIVKRLRTSGIKGISRPLCSETAEETLATLYGYEFIEQTITVQIRHDGSAMLTRRIELEAWGNVSEVRHYLTTLVSDGEAKKISFRAYIDPPDSPRSADFHWEVMDTPSRDGLLVSRLWWDPVLRPGDKVTYVTEESTGPGSFALDRAECRRRNQANEWISWGIYTPTRKLTVTALFPLMCELVDIRSDAAYGGGIKFPRHREEADSCIKALQSVINPTNQCPSLIFTKDHPTLGLHYILTWKYPERYAETA